MVEVYKILSDKYDRDVSADFLPLYKDSRGNNNTRGNSLKLLKRKPRLDICKYSFSHRVVDWWNSLPHQVVSAPSIFSFENRLDKHWANLIVKYDIDTALASTRPLTALGGQNVDLVYAG